MSFSFGGNTSTATSAFGASKPSFSFGSTNTATTSTAGFGGFGTNTSSSGFGSTFGAATSSAAPFGGLSTTPASTAPSLFGGGGFGATAAKPTTGFGSTGFGTNAFGTSGGFGAGTSTFGSTAPAFGQTNTLGSNTGFGAGSTFGSTFGKPATTGFGGFGTGLGASNAFGAQPQQQQTQPQQTGPSSAHEALVAAVFNCCVFGDERDQVLAKWNLVQAQWGVGQAYYSRNAPALQLTESNPLCRFKAVGYSRLAANDDKDGHVALLFHKTEQEIKANQQALTSSLFSILGNKQNLQVNIESIKAVSETKTQVVIFVVDSGSSSRVGSRELWSFLSGAGPAAALAAAGCVSAADKAKADPRALQQYLQTPPPGMDMRLWKQAQADNPDPENYIPVPIIGFSEIKFRSRCQSEQAALQGEWLRGARAQLGELRNRRAAAAAALARLAANHHALRHKLLQVIGRQQVSSLAGVPLCAAEEAARARLNELITQLAAPPLHNGRLNELLCAVRLQRSASSTAAHERYQLDPGAQEDVKQFLVLQQRSMAHLLDTARKDISALNTIAEGMANLVRT